MRVRVRTIPLVVALTVIAEVIVFVLVARQIGFGWAFLALLGTSLIGVALVRREGVRAWRRYRAVVEAGERPGPHLIRSLVGLVGAGLVLLPGFITDVVGLALFIPPVRVVASRTLNRVAEREMGSSMAGHMFGPRRVRVYTNTAETTAGGPIEGEIIDPG